MRKNSYLHDFLFQFTCPYCGKTDHDIMQCKLPSGNTLYYSYCDNGEFFSFLHLDSTFYLMLRNNDEKFNHVSHIFDTRYTRAYSKVVLKLNLDCEFINHRIINLSINRSFLDVSIKGLNNV